VRLELHTDTWLRDEHLIVTDFVIMVDDAVKHLDASDH
jgi:hypothetical protein